VRICKKDISVQTNKCPKRATLNMGELTSFEVGGVIPHGLKRDQELEAPVLFYGPQKHCCHFMRSGRV